MSDVDAIQRVVSANTSIRLAVLFGSSARGTNRSGSDLDVGVLVEPGTDLVTLEVAFARAARRSVDVIDLETAPPLLRFEIARDGVLLVERVPHAWADFRARAMVDWWDWVPTARIFQAAAVSRLRRQTSHGSS